MPKRKGSPAKQAKKAKVEKDPVQDAAKQLVSFFQDDARIPDEIEDAVTTAIENALTPDPAERAPMEQIFAKVVGDVLAATVKSIDEEVKTTGAEQAQVDAEEAACAAGVEAATAQQKAMAEGLQAAKAAEKQAEEGREEKAGLLKAHEKKIKNLAGEKKGLEAEEAELAHGLELLKKQDASKADAKKVVAMLKQHGASDSVCVALPNALGKSGGFEGMVLEEANKILGTAYSGITHKQKNWEAHCQGLFDGTQRLAADAKAGADLLAARQAEISAAQEADKVAKKAKKDADGKLADAKKLVASKSKVSGAAAARKEAADLALAAYELLYTRPAPAPEAPEVPEDEAEAAPAGMDLD